MNEVFSCPQRSRLMERKMNYMTFYPIPFLPPNGMPTQWKTLFTKTFPSHRQTGLFSMHTFTRWCDGKFRDLQHHLDTAPSANHKWQQSVGPDSWFCIFCSYRFFLALHENGAGKSFPFHHCSRKSFCLREKKRIHYRNLGNFLKYESSGHVLLYTLCIDCNN